MDQQRECLELTCFTTISPTCEEGGNPAAWERFRDGNYIAIGWCYDQDLTGMSLNQILPLVINTSVDESDERDGLYSFPIFWELCERGARGCGDFVAVRNVNHGLFGVGIIRSGYQYNRRHHFTGVTNHYYPHFLQVEWVWRDYIRSDEIDFGSEIRWRPFGTLSKLYHGLPQYIIPYTRLSLAR
jgi:hypothetical protein